MLKSITFGFGMVFMSHVTVAAECRFNQYRPEQTMQKLVADLAEDNISVVPSRYILSDDDTGWQLIEGRYILGRIDLSQDIVEDTAQLIIKDSQSAILMQNQLQKRILRDDHHNAIGKEESLSFSFAHQPEDQGFAPLTVVNSPFGTDYYTYQRRTNVTIWGNTLEDYWGRFLRAPTSKQSQRTVLTADSPRQKFRQILAQTPRLIPYLEDIRITEDASGAVILSGVVGSNLAYDMILLAARHTWDNFRPNITIDSGYKPVRRDLPSLPACMD